MADAYDITVAFQRIEEELISSMIRNMNRHRAEEDKEGILWTQWQTEQLRALEKYKAENRKKYEKQFRSINAEIGVLIRQARQTGSMEQEIAILNAIKNGFKVQKRAVRGMTGEFFRLNTRKLEALIKATTDDMKKAETAILRMADDKYRQVIYNAQIYANTGAGTYEKAVDMATKNLLAAGLNCVEYANGARHTLPDYADMAIRTASKRAYLQGEGEKRVEWGITTVIMNKRGNPCPKCLPFVGKVLIDDVWSGGKGTDGPYPLMSTAIKVGLYHPRCKDSHTTYFPGISTADDTWTKEELEEIGLNAKQEARQQYAERQVEKYERLEKYSLNKDNKRAYGTRVEEWKKRTQMLKNEETRVAMTDKTFFVDITKEWQERAKPNSHEIVDLQEFSLHNILYKVDGKNVVLDYTQKEKEIAKLLEAKLGGEIYMVPKVSIPQGVATPDYIFRGEKFDLKEIIGSSKNVLYNAIAKKKRQANNFVIDISKCPLEEGEIIRQIGDIYWSRHTDFVDKIIVIKKNEIIRIFERSKKIKKE